jgi:hypothetical protein
LWVLVVGLVALGVLVRARVFFRVKSMPWILVLGLVRSVFWFCANVAVLEVLVLVLVLVDIFEFLHRKKRLDELLIMWRTQSM